MDAQRWWRAAYRMRRSPRSRAFLGATKVVVLSKRRREMNAGDRTSITYVHTTWPARRPVDASFSPVPRPLRNWCRISSSSNNGIMSKRSMYLRNNSPTADTSFSSISLRPERAREGVEGTLDCLIIRAMVMSRGTYVNLTSTSLGTFNVRW